MDVALSWTQELGVGTFTLDTQHTFNFEDTIGLFDDTEEDKFGEAGHPDWVGNLNLSLLRDPWSFYWGVTYISETNNYESFGTSTASWYCDEEVNLDLTAEARTYHKVAFLPRLSQAGQEPSLPRGRKCRFQSLRLPCT